MVRNLVLPFVTLTLMLRSVCAAQTCDPRSGPPVQMQVQLAFGESQASDAVPGTISDQKDSMHRDEAAGGDRSRGFDASMQIRVQLQDALGGTIQESTPNAEGKLQFTVCSDGSYRLRVTGVTIDETQVEDLQPGRGDRMVNVTLHHKGLKPEPNGPNKTVSARELHIPKKAQAQLDKGDSALRQNRLELAGSCYAKAIEIYPEFAQAHNNLGIVLVRQGKRDQGRAAFERALTIDSEYAPAQLNLAKIAFDEKRFLQSLDLSRRVLKTEPLNTSALFVATESAFFTGDYAQTISYARTLHALPHKQYALIHFLAGKSLEAEHRPVEAIREYQAFIAEDPNDPNVARARDLLLLLQASRLPDPGAPH